MSTLLTLPTPLWCNRCRGLGRSRADWCDVGREVRSVVPGVSRLLSRTLLSDSSSISFSLTKMNLFQSFYVLLRTIKPKISGHPL